ncbi:MAG: hypothetical protein ACXAD7_09760 [Candidatus Kariarchaeaceae archaeon]|jgi:hypothetical protein
MEITTNLRSDRPDYSYSDKAKKIRLLRISYWIAAILDALFALDMYYVATKGSTSKLSYIFSLETVGPDAYRYALALFGGVAISWTILLIWADQKPVERKGILLVTITIFTGLMVANLIGQELNVLATERFTRRWIVFLSLIALFAYSYWNARDLQITTESTANSMSDEARISSSDQEKKIRLIRISLWIGAIGDALFAVDLYNGSIFGSSSILSYYYFSLEKVSSDEYRYALAVFGAGAISWTILLIWAVQKPVERKGILLVTIIVVSGLFIANLIAMQLNLLPVGIVIFRWIVELHYIGLLAYSYWKAREL